MPRELVVSGVLIPTLLALFIASMGLQLAADWLLGKFNVYARLWHPALVRLCLFAGIFATLILFFYE